jgi:hypothetical protein
MQVEIKTFNNVYGYPSIDRELLKTFKSYTVMIGVESLFSRKFVQGENFIIVIDAFGKLRTSGIPILGYVRTPSFVWVRSRISKHDIVPNSTNISHPFYLNGAKTSARPSLSLLLEFNDCSTLEQYQAMQCKYEADIKAPKLQKFKWLRRNLNQMLKDLKDE